MVRTQFLWSPFLIAGTPKLTAAQGSLQVDFKCAGGGNTALACESERFRNSSKINVLWGLPGQQLQRPPLTYITQSRYAPT